MRQAPVLGDKVWFGPKRWGGWGWEPVSWEGWVATVVVIALSIGGGLILSRDVAIATTLISVVILLALCALKGTSPGGPDERAAFLVRRRGFPGGTPVQRRLRQQTPDEPSVPDAARRLHERNGGDRTR